MKDKLKWSILVGGVTVVGAVLTRRALVTGWSRLGLRAPEDDPELDELDLRDALMWSAVAGAVVGVARLGARRSAAAIWRKAGMGQPPT